MKVSCLYFLKSQELECNRGHFFSYKNIIFKHVRNNIQFSNLASHYTLNSVFLAFKFCLEELSEVHTQCFKVAVSLFSSLLHSGYSSKLEQQTPALSIFMEERGHSHNLLWYRIQFKVVFLDIPLLPPYFQFMGLMGLYYETTQ